MFEFIYKAHYQKIVGKVKTNLHVKFKIKADSFLDAWMKMEKEHKIYAPEYKRVIGTLETIMN